jgi:LmbE family N-acetylglucosaminyl deacetylase
MKILIIAAHPDDEVLGMGGTIKKYTKSKNKVKIVILATGIFARRSQNLKNSTKYNVKKDIKEKMLKQKNILREESKEANKILGVKDIEFYDFPDNEMDTISNLEITKTIENIIEKFKPSVIYTHSPIDVNIDHKMIFYATLTATRPTRGNSVKEVYSFEIPSSSEWNFTEAFNPNTFVDIEKELSYKIKAMQKYKSEIEKFPHPRSPKALEAIAHRWGTVSGVKAAEAFVLIRNLKNI